MKRRKVATSVVILGLLVGLAGVALAQGTAPQGAPAGTAFTYQGRLADGSGPVTGTCDFTFRLYDAAGSGSPPAGGTLAGTDTVAGAAVEEGYFTAEIDFGAGAFPGEARWLEIEVNCGVGSVILSPRQALTPTPYALWAAVAPWSGLAGVPAGLADGVDGDALAGLSCDPGEMAVWDGAEWVCGGAEATTYSSGTGLRLSGGRFSLARTYRLPQACADGQVPEFDETQEIWVCAADDDALGGLACADGEVAEWDDAGGAWVCAADSAAGHLAGNQLSLVGTTFHVLEGAASGLDADLLDGMEGADYQARVSGTCPAGESIRVVNTDGTVVCEADDSTADHGVLSGLGDDDHTQYFNLSQNEAVNGRPSFNGGTSGSTAPFSVDSTYLVSNLNADLLDGQHGSAYQARVDGTCAAGQSIREVNADGTVVCETDDGTDYTAGTGLGLSGTQFSVAGSYRLPQGCASGKIAEWNGSAWVCADDDTAAGGGSSWLLAGNGGTTAGTDFLGTTDSQPLELKVNNARALRLVPSTGAPSVVAGGDQNSVSAGAVGAAIGGGGRSSAEATPRHIPYVPCPDMNSVTDDRGTVSGGADNAAGNNNTSTNDASYATVGGGSSNVASGELATVGGGLSNTASGRAATVGGGMGNRVKAAYATIAGGGPSDLQDAANTHNRTYDDYGTIGGGGSNIAGDLGSDKTSATYATVAGGLSNWAFSTASTVGGGRSNMAGEFGATVAGGAYNDARGRYATIAGGGPSDENDPTTTRNRVVEDFGTIGGGGKNTAGATGRNALYATVGGGEGNVAGDSHATVGGGGKNRAGGAVATADYATVGGGEGNMADGSHATVGGGEGNKATGDYATIPGGHNAIADVYGQMAYASGSFADPGDAQAGFYILRGETNGSDYTTKLYLDGGGEELRIARSQTVAFDGLVVARGDDARSAAWAIKGLVKHEIFVGGREELVLVGVPTRTLLGDDATAWGVEIGVDATSNVLRFEPAAHPADGPVRWVATVRTAEVSWPAP